jgi:SAM-dependent methyltransferase
MPQINDLLFSELIKRGFRTEGNTRIWNLADSKLWYLTPKQAQGFLDLEKTEGYKESIIEKEISLISQNLSSMINLLKNKKYNLIDLGCGDGKKASLFIKELSKKINLKYCPIDISFYMVNKAAETIRKLNVGEVLEFHWNISDFENLENVTPLFRNKNFKNYWERVIKWKK